MNKTLIKDKLIYLKNVLHSKQYKKTAINALYKYKEKYLLMFFITKKAFLKTDPAGISFVGWDEYDEEIILIASKLCSIKHFRFNHVKKIISEVLKQNFMIEDEYYSVKLTKLIFKNLKKYKKNFSFSKELPKLINHYKQTKKEKIKIFLTDI